MQRHGVVVEGEEAEVGASDRAQLLLGDPGKTALGVLHDDDRVDAEQVDRHRQAAQHVVGDPASRVADDVGVAEVQTEGGVHVDAVVHARDHGQPAARLAPSRPFERAAT